MDPPLFVENHSFYLSTYQGESQLAYQSTKFPLLNAWMEKMKKDPAVLDYILDDDTHAAFVKTITTGAPNYDLLLDQ